MEGHQIVICHEPKLLAFIWFYDLIGRLKYVKIESFCGELKSICGAVHPIAGLMVIFLRGLDCSRINYSCSMLFYGIFVFGNDVILVSLVSLRPYHAFRIVNPD